MNRTPEQVIQAMTRELARLLKNIERPASDIALSLSARRGMDAERAAMDRLRRLVAEAQTCRLQLEAALDELLNQRPPTRSPERASNSLGGPSLLQGAHDE